MTKILTAVAFSLMAIATTPAFADDACASFKWSLASEQGWLAAAHPTLASGGAFSQAPGAATLQLSPAGEVKFEVTPDHKPATETFAAIVSVPPLDKDGVYQVTLSDEGWIDVIQGGAAVKSSAYSGKKGCPAIRKSVRFDLKAGPVTLQISGVKSQTINVAFGPAA